MSAALTLAGPEHLEKIDALVAAFHVEEGISLSDEARRAGLTPMLEGIPHGAAYLIGPAQRAHWLSDRDVRLVTGIRWVGWLHRRDLRATRRTGAWYPQARCFRHCRARLQAPGSRQSTSKSQNTRTGRRLSIKGAGFVPRDGYLLMTRAL